MSEAGSARSSDMKRLLSVAVGFSIVAGALACCYLLSCEVGGNFREVVSRKVYRSAQPSGEQLKLWTERYGIRTVLNLRGDAGKATEEERAAADELGLRMISVPIRSYDVLSRASLIKLIEAIEAAELPVLIHCRDGIDRGGTVSAMAAMAIGKETYDQARWEAYVPPGPWKRRRRTNYAHISDLFKDYEAYRRGHGVAADDWEQFKRWAYDRSVSAKYTLKGSKYPRLEP